MIRVKPSLDKDSRVSYWIIFAKHTKKSSMELLKIAYKLDASAFAAS